MNKSLFVLSLPLILVCTSGLFRQSKLEAKPLESQEELALQTPPRPLPPFKTYISGTGIIEPSSESLFIGTPINRVVDQVLVKVGDRVKKGDILLRLEDRDLQADLHIRQVAYEIALAQQRRLESMPRPEDVLPAEAALKSAQLELDQAKNQYEMVQGLRDARAMSREEINRRYFNYQQAQARGLQAQAHLDKIKAGAWRPEIEIAKLEVKQALANVERIQADIERTLIRSPIDGSVLQVKIHEGEFPPVDLARTPILILGNTDEMNLRVSINQFEMPNFLSDAPAVAFSQGDARVEFPLEFVRLEPYLVHKQNLTNDILEKVDTRVLQIIYRLKKNTPTLFVGQQMDVYIETDDSPESDDAQP